MQKSALIAGSTGLIGSYLLEGLNRSDSYTSIHSISRKKPDVSSNKLHSHTVNFNELSSLQLTEEITDAFCCLGTTMNKAGSKEAFYEVDFTFVQSFASFALQQGAQRCFLVSALGADSHSKIFYNQVKGEIEEELSAMGFKALHIFRPSLLIGDRNEFRIGEAIGQKLAQWLDFIVPKKYAAIGGDTVAHYMLHIAETSSEEGICIHESRDMH